MLLACLVIYALTIILWLMHQRPLLTYFREPRRRMKIAEAVAFEAQQEVSQTSVVDDIDDR